MNKSALVKVMAHRAIRQSDTRSLWAPDEQNGQEQYINVLSIVSVRASERHKGWVVVEFSRADDGNFIYIKGILDEVAAQFNYVVSEMDL